jgi:hypothetical protein
VKQEPDFKNELDSEGEYTGLEPLIRMVCSW